MEVSEETVQRAMREGGEVTERSVTTTYSGEEPTRPTTAITWNGREIDQAAVLAGGHPARARVLASNDPIPEFGPDVKLLDLEVHEQGSAEPRRIFMVPVIVPEGREGEIRPGSVVDVRIDRDDPDVVVVAWP